MARRNDGAGNSRGADHGAESRLEAGRRRPRARRGVRLGALAALALVLPIALAAPAAGRTGAEPVAVESATAGGTGDQAARGPALPDAEAGAAEFSHRHYYSTWRDARTYWSQESRYPTGGWLWAGRHYFFCQAEGEPHSDGEGGYSTWWALTDDDTGNRDVFVSATAFGSSEPWQPIEGLPRC
ncbi:hypothetical protein [Nocardiopsis ganjiahuensis]|uniref:hypothetical protein n=1 Tax=Nocardiopsis ganjiahuensis TaxID=239984 RepID=UPI000363FA04|nr:hypothetical protein [Nocardiopsis ganjiahuensis]